MKKTTILLFCLAWTATAFSQYHALTQATYPYPVTKTIVREYSYPATISYVETADSHYFAIADHPTIIHNSVIDHNIFVRDFVIFDDIVYFCGIDKTSGTNGIFGWFPIGSLINGNLVYYTYSQFTCNSYLVDTLHSLTVFQGLDNPHIVTVGTTIGGGAARGCTIDINQTSSGQWPYTIGVTPERERLKHVCQTGNWVVTSGPSGFSVFEGYRVHRKINIFTPGGINDDVWVFVMSNYSPGTRDIEQYAITPMTGDIVASALRVNNTSSGYGIQVFAHNMNNLVNGAINPVFSCKFNNLTKPLDVYGLKYDMINKALVLLLNGDMAYPIPITGDGSIVAEIPVTSTSSYPFNCHILSGKKLISLDLYDSQHSFLCQGIAFGSNYYTFSFTQPLNSSALCANTTPATGSDEDYMTKMEYRPYTLCQDSIAFTVHQQLGRIDTPNIIQCQY